MNNKKGYTLLELIIVLAFSSAFLYSVFYVPIDMFKKDLEYTKFSEETSDVYLLRSAIAKDIVNENVVKVNDNTLTIGNKKYTFEENGVKRDSVFITRNPYLFELNGDNLKIFNDNSTLEYKIGSSFSRGEHYE